MKMDINKILCFSLKGKFAHFRKFYTNSSSLSYLIPPRTVIMGIIASILELPRDNYYEELGTGNVCLTVAVPPGKPLTKQMQSMNYLHDKYFDLVAKGADSGKAQHSQCKLELLTGFDGNPVEYIVYVGFNSDNDMLSCFEKKVSGNNWGYGVCLGQQQFRGYIEHPITYLSNEFEILEKSAFLDTVCIQENIFSMALNQEVDIQKEQMPSDFTKTSNGRESSGTQQVVFEKNGQRLAGEFKNCVCLNSQYISFY